MTGAQLWIDTPPTWHRVKKFSRVAAALADRHYSRQTVGSDQLLPPGETLLLITPDELAVWGVVHNLQPGNTNTYQWRCTIFRNEGGQRSSDLVRAATALTFDSWPRRYGRLPAVPLTTEIDAAKVRRKRDPGRCFRKAGWASAGFTSKGLVLLVAPTGGAE